MLIPCAACGRMVSRQAVACPECGHPVSDSLPKQPACEAPTAAISPEDPPQPQVQAVNHSSALGESPSSPPTERPLQPPAPKRRGKLARFLFGTCIVAVTLAVKWSIGELLIANNSARWIGRSEALLQDLTALIVWIGVSSLLIRWSLRNGLPRYWLLWSAVSVGCIPVVVQLTHQALPRVKASADAAYQRSIERELSPEQLAEGFRTRLASATQHEPQHVELPREFQQLSFTIPSGLPRVEQQAVKASELGPLFSAGTLYTGRNEVLMVKVECCRINDGYALDLSETAKAYNDEMLKRWASSFSSLDLARLSSNDSTFLLLDPRQQSMVEKTLRATRIKQDTTGLNEVAGVASVRTVFSTAEGMPLAVRSEVFQHNGVLVNVVASAITPDELTTGPVEEFFNSLRFGGEPITQQ